jgi:tRNA pseudouridine38-40 synthase
MGEAAEVFVGEHDFTSFAAADEKDALGHSKVRRIYRSTLRREGAKLIYDVEGSGFLKHMVRNLMGTLLEAGKGNLGVDGVRRLLEPPYGRCGPTVPGGGLFLVEVRY